MKTAPLKDILAPLSNYLSGIVFVVVFLVYANTLNHQFALDDYSIIINHSYVQNGIEGIPDILKTNYRHGQGGFNDGLYRPLSLVTFALEKSFFNSDPSIGHLINVLLYAIAASLLFKALRKLFFNAPLIVPLGIVLLFALHPLHTEVVANIKGRDEVLAFLGFSGTLVLALRYLESSNKSIALFAILSFLLALFSKESAVTYALIIPAVMAIDSSIKKRDLFKIGGALAVFSIAFAGLRYYIVNSMQRAIDPGNFGLLNNPIAASSDPMFKWGGIFELQWVFIQKLMFPFQLLHDYSYNQIPLIKLSSVKAILGILLLLGLSFLSSVLLKKRNVWSILALVYLGTIAVISQILVTVGIQFAERMLFLAVLPLSILIVLGAKHLLQKKNAIFSLTQQKTLALLVIVLGGLYSFKTLERNAEWENNFTLFGADIKKGSNSARINYNYGSELNEQAMKTANATQKNQLHTDAAKYLQRAIQIYPDYQDAYNNLGLVFKELGQFDKSILTHRKNLEKHPNYTKGYFNLGTTYYAKKDYRSAIQYLQEYCNRQPNQSNAYFLMGQAAGLLGEFNEAVDYLNRSLDLQPNEVNVINYLGMAYGMSNQAKKAEQQFLRALNLSPQRTDILMNLALNYHNQGLIIKEKEVLNRVLSIQPNNAAASNQLQQLENTP